MKAGTREIQTVSIAGTKTVSVTGGGDGPHMVGSTTLVWYNIR
jgi:hypothetical protein